MGLINFVSRLQKEDEVVIPIFDRSLELSRSSAVIISKNSKVILVEGNYILLNSHILGKNCINFLILQL